jgi:hypothetical protein
VIWLANDGTSMPVWEMLIQNCAHDQAPVGWCAILLAEHGTLRFM